MLVLIVKWLFTLKIELPAKILTAIIKKIDKENSFDKQKCVKLLIKQHFRLCFLDSRVINIFMGNKLVLCILLTQGYKKLKAK